MIVIAITIQGQEFIYNASTGAVDTAKDKKGNSTFNKFYYIEDAREFARNYNK
jgi:hypothetical protein